MRCRNIYVLPGVPALLRQKWAAVKAILMAEAEAEPCRNAVLRLSLSDETQIATALEVVVVEFGTDVDIGSYPVQVIPFPIEYPSSHAAGIALQPMHCTAVLPGFWFALTTPAATAPLAASPRTGATARRSSSRWTAGRRRGWRRRWGECGRCCPVGRCWARSGTCRC